MRGGADMGILFPMMGSGCRYLGVKNMSDSKSLAKAAPAVPKITVQRSDAGGCSVNVPHDFRESLKAVFGVDDADFAENTLQQIVRIEMSDDSAATQTNVNSSLAAIAGIGPKDGVESMLASQMAMIHSASLESLRLANQSVNSQVRQAHLNQSVKLCRTFSAQIDSLNRHRGRGQQKISVEHVHVHNGGQAVVGNISKSGEG